ncbi:MAG: hypothetical protein C0518_05370 [Opitutus sp.]|nr:hypothetical protein [Opitutus sp.]
MRLRVSIACTTFATAEVEAADVASVLANPPAGQMKFQTGPIVHRVERLVPDPDDPSQSRWEEVDLLP